MTALQQLAADEERCQAGASQGLTRSGNEGDENDNNGGNDANNDDDGLPAYSHHGRFPPWWVFVRDDNGGNLSGDKIPP